MTELDLFSRLSPTASPKGKPRITARNPEEKSMSRPSFASLSLGTFPPRGRLNFCRIQGFPLPEKKFSKLHFFRQKCEAFPYVKASPCFFLLSQKSAKIVSRYAASPRGEAPPKGGGEGQLHLPCQKFSNKGAVTFSSRRFRSISAKKPGCISYLRIICNPADFLQFFVPRFRKGTKYTP